MSNRGGTEKFLLDELQQKQRFVPTPSKMDKLVSQLLTRRGYARVQAISQFAETWSTLVGQNLAKLTRAGTIRSGVLEVACQNSAVLQEIAFKKQVLINQLNDELAGNQVVDIKLRVVEF